MSERLFPRGEDDKETNRPDEVDYEEYDLTDERSGQGPKRGDTSRPGDPSIEEMLRRARDSGMDDTPQPGEPYIPMRFDE